jgi:ATP-dependent helicase/nuclease subunit A
MAERPSRTPEQVEAITSTRHTLLSAGAGTGKTTTLIGKLLWHLGLDAGCDERTDLPLDPCRDEHRCSLSEIVAITFTEKAAYDLKRKLREELERVAPDLLWELDLAAIGTIHSFCGQLLREHAFRFGIDPSFTVLDERESRLELIALIRQLVLERLTEGDPRAEGLVAESTSIDGWEHQKGPLDLIATVIGDLRWHGPRYQDRLRNGALDAAALEQIAGAWDEKDDRSLERLEGLRSLAAEALARWKERLLAENQRDFDALVLDCRDLLGSEAGRPALHGIRSRTRLLVIDEFQDTDGAQRDIAFLLAGLDGPPGTGHAPLLFLVGDPKQSIYGFRGADIAVWNEVRNSLAKFGPALELSGNFRSDPAVVGYVNRVCTGAFGTTGAAVESEGLSSRVQYSALRPMREPLGVGAVEWLVALGDSADERRALEAEAIAARIRHLVVDGGLGGTEGVQVVDPETGKLRACKYRDVAILFRARTGLDLYLAALARAGVPYYLAGDAGLTDRLEIADLLNLFRLVTNPLDDLAALTYLRSPFVGLRDELLARMRLDKPDGPLLHQARRFLEQRWFQAPEHPRTAAVEREALRAGLDLVEEMVSLRSRVPIDQLAGLALDRTAYTLHLLLLPNHEARLANLTRFVRVLEGYRNQTLGTFLELWDRWEDQDLGIPQAPLFSKRDDVVTLSTIHAAKGLEWPVVVLAGLDGKPTDRLGGEVWTDRELGPVLGVKQDERGARTERLCNRRMAEEQAEESRLVYVAATRARDRLIIAGPAGKDAKGRGEWLWKGVNEEVTVQLRVPEVTRPSLPPEPSLSWLDDIQGGAADAPLVLPLRKPPLRFTRSATELMSFARDRREWRLVYEHGVLPERRFVPARAGAGLSPTARGTLIHEVLARIEDERELAEMLDVAVGALDSPELEERLARGTTEREAISTEIQQVIGSPEWRSYVDGPHWRELRFVQFHRPTRWYVGAFDLYRPGNPEGLIVDFKTQAVEPEQVEVEAEKYRLQALVYRSVARRLGIPSRIRFHFTRPNRTVEGRPQLSPGP